MAEGKGLLLQALPFFSGIVTGNILADFIGRESVTLYILAGCMPVFAGVSAVFALKKCNDFTIARTVSVLALTCFLGGIFCSLSSALSPGSGFFPEELKILMTGAAERLKDLIDSIPFKDDRCNALAKALLTGDRRSLPRDLVTAFRKSGASHLLALSGMHLGIIYLIISRPLSFLFRSRAAAVARYILTISSTMFYTGMTGWSPSTVRALIFISLRETSVLTGRKTDIAGAISAALIIQCALKPDVVNSVSFQMSYLAMAGIAFIHPVMRKWFPAEQTKFPSEQKDFPSRNRFFPPRWRHFLSGLEKSVAAVFGKIWEAASLSISCQLTTGPLAWFRFGSAPVYFLITNLIAIPLTTLAIPATTAAAFITAIHSASETSAICGLIVSGAGFILESLIFCIGTIASLP